MNALWQSIQAIVAEGPVTGPLYYTVTQCGEELLRTTDEHAANECAATANGWR